MIDILLATYNSLPYLEETIKSILDQDNSNWRLLICDGGSKDTTAQVIQRYSQMYPEQILWVPAERPLNTCQNFAWLLEQSKSDYLMFCDHDDVWLPDKVSKTWAVMQHEEQKYGQKTPLLIFTDLRVVSYDCTVLSDSSLKYQYLNPKRTELNQLLLQNVPSGCTMMINRALVDMSRPIPEKAVMHDHWVSLVAAAFGQIIFLDEASLLYRQHGNNYYGAPRYGWGHFYTRCRQGIHSVRGRLSEYIDQANTFYDRYSEILQPHHQQMLSELSNWPQLSWLERRKVLLRHKILKTGLRRNIGLFFIA